MQGFQYFISTTRLCFCAFGIGFLLHPSLAFEKEIEIDLEFRVFSLDRAAIEGLFYQVEPGEIAPLKFASRSRSAPHRYRGSPNLSIYRKNASAEENALPYLVVGSVEIPPQAKEPLIFFLPLPSPESGEASGYRILAMEDSPQFFPYGYMRVLNASGAPLSGQVGDQGLQLGFEVSPAWSTKSLFSQGGQWVNLALFVQIRDDRELVYANQLTFDSDARSILVVRPPRRKNSLRVVTYVLEDYRKPEESLQANSK